MNHVERVFSQADASRLSGISPDILRDWRRRDLLGNLGERGEGDRWRYSFDEILRLAIVKALEPNGQTIGVLLFMAFLLADSVIDELRGSPYDGFSRANSAFWFNESGNLMKPISLKSLDDLSAVPAPSPQFILVNSARLASVMPEGIKLLVGTGEAA
ncbi:MAG TPA: MerR family transcriptional regulator [Gammaproteobacteria bacterium]